MKVRDRFRHACAADEQEWPTWHYLTLIPTLPPARAQGRSNDFDMRAQEALLAASDAPVARLGVSSKRPA
eukprot:6577488-Pyramimonas_sp.AAC.1